MVAKAEKSVIWHRVKAYVLENGQSAAKAQIEQGSTTIPPEGSTTKRWEVGRP